LSTAVRSSGAQQPGGALSSGQIWFVVAGLMVGGFLSTLDVLVVITALPTIVGDLGGRAELSWVLTAYLLASTVAGPLFGRLSDLVGRRRLYELSIVIFVVGSVLGGISQNIYELIVARVIQGIGAGGLMTLPFAIVADISTPRERARYTSVMVMNFTVASVLGPLIGGLFVDHASWRWIFFINIPLGALALLASLRTRLPVQRAQKVVIDYLGTLLMVGATSALLLAFTWGGSEHAWDSATIVALFAGAAVLTSVLIWWERRTDEPLLPPRLFANARFNLLVGSTLLAAIAMYSGWALMPIFLQVVTGASATNSGVLVLPFVAGNTIASLVTGRIVARTGRAKWAPVLGQLIAAGGFFLYTTMDAETTRFTASVFMAVAGFGLGMALQIVMVIGQSIVDPGDLGAGTAMIAFFRNLGSSFGAAIGLGTLNSQLSHNLDLRLGPGQLARLPSEALQGSPAAIRGLAPGVRHAVVAAFADALHSAFVVTFPTALAGLALFLFVRHVRLGDRLVIEDPEVIAESHASGL
jgi:EmrB/QacA subfamily drug resistance transporter